MQIRAPIQTDKNNGFTIVEMMITITVITIILALALPNLTQFFARNNLAGTTNELIAGINQARSEAVTRSTIVSICPSNDGVSCDPGNWEGGWIVFLDPNNNRSIDAGENIVNLGNNISSDAVTIDGFNGGLTFTSSGLLSGLANGVIQFTHPQLTVIRQLNISSVGQIEISEIQS